MSVTLYLSDRKPYFYRTVGFILMFDHTYLYLNILYILVYYNCFESLSKYYRGLPTHQQQINYDLYCLFKDHYLRHTIIHETVLKEIVCHCSFIYLFMHPSKLRLPHCIIILYNILHNAHVYILFGLMNY